MPFGVQPNIVVIRSARNREFMAEEGFDELVGIFENAETFGSLIRIPGELLLKLPGIKRYIQELDKSDLFVSTNAELLKRLTGCVRQVKNA